MSNEILGWALLAVGVIALAVILIFFSPPARLRRRLKKTHSRVVSKSSRPMVKFSVKPPKE